MELGSGIVDETGGHGLVVGVVEKTSEGRIEVVVDDLGDPPQDARTNMMTPKAIQGVVRRSVTGCLRT